MALRPLIAALDVARSPGELALALVACAAVVVGAGYCGWLAYGGSRKD